MSEGEWGLIVAFPDESAPFVHGFEAGQIWEAMTRSDPTIERCVHTANKEVIERMARQKGYSITWVPTSLEEWTDVKLKKTEPESHLRAVT